MSQFTAFVHYVGGISLLCHVSIEMTEFAVLRSRRCDNTASMLSPASNTDHVLECTKMCQETADCNSINFASNKTEESCELLLTSEQDLLQLTLDGECSFYSTNLHMTSGDTY